METKYFMLNDQDKTIISFKLFEENNFAGFIFKKGYWIIASDYYLNLVAEIVKSSNPEIFGKYLTKEQCLSQVKHRINNINNSNIK